MSNHHLRNKELQCHHNVVLCNLFFQLAIIGVKAFFLRLQLFILRLQGGDAGELAVDLRHL